MILKIPLHEDTKYKWLLAYQACNGDLTTSDLESFVVSEIRAQIDLIKLQCNLDRLSNDPSVIPTRLSSIDLSPYTEALRSKLTKSLSAQISKTLNDSFKPIEAKILGILDRINDDEQMLLFKHVIFDENDVLARKEGYQAKYMGEVS